MLRLLLLLVVVCSIRCDVRLSTTEISMAVGEIKSLQVEISNASLNGITRTFTLQTRHTGLVGITLTNVSANLDSKEVTYSIKLEALRAGKFNVFTTVGSLVSNDSTDEWNGKVLLLVKVYKNDAVEWVSIVLGWCYFIAWSFSFYPQLYTNYRNKSVVGLSFDFVLFNVYGYAMYTSFNMGMYFVPIVKEQYAKRHPNSPLPVQPNDLIFSGHSVFIGLSTIIQCIAYESGDQKLSTKAKLIMAHYVVATVTFVALACCDVILWLDVFYLFSYTKLFVTITKYVPQIYLNYQRKTTKGWSIGSVVLDLIGGVLSIHQMILNGYNYEDWAIIVENPTKFGLGLLSVTFALILATQHLVFYRNCPAQTQINLELNETVVLTGVISLKDQEAALSAEKLDKGVVLKPENLIKAIDVEPKATKGLDMIREEVEDELDENETQCTQGVFRNASEGFKLKLIKVTKIEQQSKGAMTQEVHDGLFLEVTSIPKCEENPKLGLPRKEPSPSEETCL